MKVCKLSLTLNKNGLNLKRAFRVNLKNVFLKVVSKRNESFALKENISAIIKRTQNTETLLEIEICQDVNEFLLVIYNL